MGFRGILILVLFFSVTAYAQTGKNKPLAANTNAAIKTIDSLNHLANDAFLRSPDDARVMAERALLLSEKIKYNYGIGCGFINIGHAYWAQSYYPISLYYLNSALNYFPKDNSSALSECYGAIGRTYTELKNYGPALKNINISLKYAGNDAALTAEVYSNLSYLYCRQGKYKQAIAATQNSLKLSRATNDLAGIGILYNRLSNIYRLKGEFLPALAYSDSALRVSYPVHNRRLRAKTFVELAFDYNGLKEYDKAITFAQKGAALSDSIGIMDGISSAYRAMAYSYEQKNDLKQSLFYQRKYTQVLDSLSTTNKLKNTELVQNYFTLSKRLDDIAAMEQRAKEDKAKINSQDTIIVILAISLLILIGALSVTYYYYKQKQLLSNRMRKQHKALLVQKELIEEQSINLSSINKLKDKLLAVIGHDLRTPLANLRSIVELFENETLSTEEVNGLMKKLDPVIKGTELTLANLLEWAGSQIKGMHIEPSAIDINLIGEEMGRVFNFPLQQKNITFQNTAIPQQYVQADEKHVKVVLNNLMSNAIKFTGDDGLITLSSKIECDMLVISITDTGNGITEDQMCKLFNLGEQFTEKGTLGETGTGIGLFLCKELVEFNRGRLWVTSRLNEGSVFSFSLPLVQ